MTQDPKRLIVSERNELGLGLASARRQLPNELELTRLARRLAEAGVAVPADLVPGGTEARPPSPHERTRGGLRFKVYTGMGLGTLAVCAVLGARLQMRSPGSAPHAAIRPANADVSSQATRILSAPAPFVPSPAPPAMPEAERSRETARALPPTAAEAATPVVEASSKPLASTSRDAARRG
ncbi:MAG TPA: hypothetical protein VFQ35_14675, partial [Polyangiaceae bacterium]|nr:hypothetical protein [Polyangiaceae bacterium]